MDGTMIPDYARAGGRTEHRAAHLWSAVALYSFSALDGVENSFPPNPTGFRLEAQGGGERATLGSPLTVYTRTGLGLGWGDVSICSALLRPRPASFRRCVAALLPAIASGARGLSLLGCGHLWSRSGVAR